MGKQQTVEQLIDWYVREVGKQASWGRSKAYDLTRIKRYPIARVAADRLTVRDYLDHAETRRVDGAGPATIGNDLVWLRQVLQSARVSLKTAVDLTALDDARRELRTRKMIGKSKLRERRVSATEEQGVIAYFEGRDARLRIPMADIVRFAILTSRRLEEITRLQWDDLRRETSTAWLDDVKHPTQKKGNRREFRIPAAAWEVIDRQRPDDIETASGAVFPFNPKSISTAFSRAAAFLELSDLRFHDLRHEATSRLFERGYSIQEVAHFTLHESWTTLRRYTHLKPSQVPER